MCPAVPPQVVESRVRTPTLLLVSRFGPCNAEYARLSAVCVTNGTPEECFSYLLDGSLY